METTHSDPHLEKRRRELRVAVLTLLLPLYVALGFSANYIGALHAPKPHGVKVAVVGPPTLTAGLAHELSVRPAGAFDVSQVASVGRARRLVGQRDLAGAFVPGADPTVIVASAGSASLASFVEAAFRGVAAARHQLLAVDDVRPLPADNSSGTPNFFFIIICTIAAFLTVVALGFLTPTLPEHQRLMIVGAACVLAPVVGYLVGGAGYGVFSGEFGTIVGMLGLGALYAWAVACITRILQVGLGKLGLLIASLTLIFLNLPSSGGIVAPQLMPGLWRFLNHFWIGAAAIDANRSALYFGGAGVATDVLKILAWVAAWALLIAPVYLWRKLRACQGELTARPPRTAFGTAASVDPGSAAA
jgi:hypothetical protein